MSNSAVKFLPFRDTQCLATEEAVERTKRTKLAAFVAWFFAPPKLPAYPPLDCAREPAAARAARLRRIQSQVDDLMKPLTPADAAWRYYHWWS